ncbi:hypothetical protein JL722_7678 [Aureococcus anophagefferens]|nr:hypothetical protein JL722_7678 [Aureococcus anophagefferens]
MRALALLITIATSSALLPSTTRAPRSALRSAPPGGADLYNGEDDERNAQVAALKRSFYGVPAAPRAEASRSRVAVRSRSSFGLLEDVPLCRWSGALLPHSQLALNVWQPQYTHLFEELFATPEPWYYARVRLPGGAANLNNPAYDFCAPDCSAPRAGTLMRVASFRREADNRLSVVVQGVASLVRRPRVLGRRALPYARADVRLAPDGEALAHGASDAWPRAWAAAVEADEAWAAYEFGAPPADQRGAAALPVLRGRGRAAADAGARARRRGARLRRAAAAGGRRRRVPRRWPRTRRLRRREAAVWVKLDALLAALRSRPETAGAVPVPSQLLGLLPRDEAWPGDFRLDGVAADLARRSAELPDDVDQADRRYVAARDNYPAHRRASRLSFAVFAVIGGGGQDALDAATAADRLALAAARLDALIASLAVLSRSRASTSTPGAPSAARPPPAAAPSRDVELGHREAFRELHERGDVRRRRREAEPLAHGRADDVDAAQHGEQLPEVVVVVEVVVAHGEEQRARAGVAELADDELRGDVVHVGGRVGEADAATGPPAAAAAATPSAAPRSSTAQS